MVKNKGRHRNSLHAMKWASMHFRAPVFYFWSFRWRVQGVGFFWIFVVLIKFSLASPVPIVFLNMFAVAPYFIPYPFASVLLLQLYINSTKGGDHNIFILGLKSLIKCFCNEPINDVDHKRRKFELWESGQLINMSHTQLINHNNTLKSGASVFSVKLFRLFRLGFPLQLERWEKKKGRASDGSVCFLQFLILQKWQSSFLCKHMFYNEKKDLFLEKKKLTKQQNFTIKKQTAL